MDARELPRRPNLEQYKKQAKDLLKARKSADPDVNQRIKKYHPRSRFALADAQFVIAREYGFESWPKFAKHIEALTGDGSPVSRFESAVEAVITGDVATLERLLGENPELIRERSTRVHRATLLHYVGANGVEDYRQKTPRNAVTIAETLIKAGAEVDAVTEMYGGGSTPLGLVATSVHPQQAGVQIALLETLLHYGASVDGAPGGWQPLTAALANGRPEAAEFLANHGARLDLEGAAGVGWLDGVKKFFNDDGSLKANATKALMEAGFRWACEYGRTSVVKFLLQRGVDLGAQDRNGQTGLHWAAIGGHFETIQLLLERRAPLEVKNVYGGTVLDQACWAAVNTGPAIDFVPIVEMLIAAGANVDAAGYPTGNERIDAVLRRHR